MTTCLKYCTPIAAVMFAGAVVWTYLVPGGLVIPTRYGTVREGQMPQKAEGKRQKAESSAHSPSPLAGEGRGEGAGQRVAQCAPIR
jgi:hypothetical protein